MLRQIISLAGALVLTASFSAAQKKPVTLDDVADARRRRLGLARVVARGR